MEVLLIIGVVYLVVGFFYALYVLVYGSDLWYWFPINALFGPLIVLHFAIRIFVFKDRRVKF